MGVPLETGRTSAFDTEDGYRIARADYELPEITAHRRGGRRRRPGPAAVGVRAAGRRRAQRPGQAQGRRGRRRPSRAIPLQPRLDAGEPAFEPCYAAARDRRALEFDYRRPDEDAARPPARAAVGRRRLARPLVPRRPRPRPAGRRGCSGSPASSAPRRSPARPDAFEPPADVDLAAVVAGQVGGEEHLVVVRARPGTAVGLRRSAVPLGPDRRRRRPAGAAHHRARAPGRPDRRLRRGRRRRGAGRGPRRRDRPAHPAGRDGAARMTAAGTADRMTRLLALVPYLTARPDGVRVAEAARDFGVPERQLQQRPRAAVDVRAARLRPRRPHRPRLRGRPGAGHLHRRHGPPAAADHRRGRRAGRRAAHAAGAARPRRAGGGQPGAGQGLRGGGSRRRPVTPVARQRRRPRAGAGRRPRRAWSAARALHLHYYVPTRDERTERTVDPMRLLLVDGKLVPGGLVPPRRGRAAVPARPGRRRRRPRRAGRPAAAGPRARRRERRLPARARFAGGPAAARPQRPLGRRLLPGRAVAHADPRRRAGRHRAHRRPGLGPPAGRLPRRRGRGRRARRARRARSPPTPAPRCPVRRRGTPPGSPAG